MTGSEAILSIDVGTGGGRLSLFGLDGALLETEPVAYSLDTPAPRTAEIDLEELWATICHGLRYLTGGPVRVCAAGVTAQMGIAVLDRDGIPLRPAITWMDRRATEQSERLAREIGIAGAYSIAGRRVDPEMSVCKLMWIDKHEHDLLHRVWRIVPIKDYLVSRLCGRVFTDPAHASYTMLYDVARRSWSSELLAVAGLCEDTLPDVRPADTVAGPVTAAAAAETGLPAGIPVAVGTTDGTAGAIGAGMVAAGVTVDVVGTTDVFLSCVDAPVFDDQGRAPLTCHALPGLWFAGGPMTTTGGCLKWFVDGFCGDDRRRAASTGESVYQLLDADASLVGPGAGGLLALTGLVGDRTPDWNANARGVLFGLSMQHSRAHVARAILEGSAFAVRRTVDVLEDMGVEIGDVRLVGGGARSLLWRQIRADVTGKRVATLAGEEASSRGAAMLAAVAAGVFPECKSAAGSWVHVSSIAEPDPVAHEFYSKGYDLYCSLRETLGPQFDRLAALSTKSR